MTPNLDLGVLDNLEKYIITINTQIGLINYIKLDIDNICGVQK